MPSTKRPTIFSAVLGLTTPLISSDTCPLRSGTAVAGFCRSLQHGVQTKVSPARPSSGPARL